MDLHKLTHTSPEIETVKDYCQQIDSIASNYINKETEFLNIVGPDDLTNRERIRKTYTTLQEKKNNKDKKDPNLLLKINTILYIPMSEVNRIGQLTEGIEVTSTDVPAFKAQKLIDLEADIRYTPNIKYNSSSFKDEYPTATVWIWCRALSATYDKDGSGQDMEGEIFDITPFIEKLSTTVGKNGGNFQITLPPLVCEMETTRDQSSGCISNYYVIKKQFIKYNTENGIPGQDIGFDATGSILKEDSDKRENFLFHNILSCNDLVFIRFETLDIEANDRLSDRDNFYVDRSNLAGKIYDMIGLIDSNTLSINAASNDVSIEITGRDLIKPFIEDGTYFYALENSQGQLNLAGDSTAKNEFTQRVFSNNALQYLSLYFNTSIENILKFVIQQLSSISIVPSTLFTSYLDRVNQTNISDPALIQKDRQLKLQKYKEQAIKDIYSWRSDLGLEEQGITNTELYTVGNPTNVKDLKSFTESEKTWTKIHDFLKFIREDKKRVVDGSKTIGWKSFNWTNDRGVQENVQEDRLPLFFYDNLYSNTRAERVSLESTLSGDLAANFRNKLFISVDKYIDYELSQTKYEKDKEYLVDSKGIWQIINLVIDKSVSTRRLVDSSMSSANGSLLNFIRKACQEPFVEFYCDTYGDKFDLIVRKPPYDKEGILSLLEGRVVSENGETSNSPVVIDVETVDVLQESLFFDDQDIYTWYHFTPQNVFLGSSQTYSMAYIPALYFKEYAEVWGSRPFEVSHNYAAYYPSAEVEIGNLSYHEEQAVRDLKFLVDCHCYLPFTRKGQITVNGDRRLKKGNIFRYKPTGEIFFIDQVQQNFSIGDSAIDRTTTLTVSRGMIEDFIHGVDINGLTNVGYFNIINTELTFPEGKNPRSKGKQKVSDEPNNIFTKFGVNKEIFNFFLRKEQLMAKDYVKRNK